jgi:hypothetical protein
LLLFQSLYPISTANKRKNGFDNIILPHKNRFYKRFYRFVKHFTHLSLFLHFSFPTFRQISTLPYNRSVDWKSPPRR